MMTPKCGVICLWFATLAVGVSPSAQAGWADPEPPRTYAYLQGGVLLSDEVSGGLRRSGSMPAFALGFGYRKTANWSFELEGLGSVASYDGPPVASGPNLATYDSERRYSLSALAFWLKATAPLEAFAPYARAGFGFYAPKLSVSGVELLFVPSSKEKGNMEPALSVAAGLNVSVGQKTFIGAEVRYLPLEARFGSLSPGRVSVGGPMVMATLGRTLAF